MKKAFRKLMTALLAVFLVFGMFIPLAVQKSYADEAIEVKYATSMKIEKKHLDYLFWVDMGSRFKNVKKITLKSSNDKVVWPDEWGAEENAVLFIPQKKGQAVLTINATYKDGSKKTYKINIGVMMAPPGGSSTPARQSIEKATVSVDSATYNGKAQKPSVTVKLNGKKLKKGTDYTVSYSNNINAGKKAVVKIKGTGNYKGSATKKFTIKKCSMSKKHISAELSDKSFEYTGKEIKPSITVYFNGKKKLKKGTDYRVSYLYNIQPGKAYVEITGKGNFESKGRLFGFTITKAKQPIKLSKGSFSVQYSELGNSTYITVSGIKGNPGLTVTSSNEAVATVKKADDKYKVTFRGAGTTTIKFKTNKETNHYKVTSKSIKVTVVDNRKKPTINAAKTSYQLPATATTLNLGVTTDSNGAISYASDNTAVATVDSSGNVAVTGKEGNAVITVSTKATLTYLSGSLKINITVRAVKPPLDLSAGNWYAIAYEGHATGTEANIQKYATDWNLAGNADAGKPVYAMANGVVENIYTDSGSMKIRYSDPLTLTNGYTFAADHWRSWYGHMQNIKVSEGQRVTAGQIVGYVGSVSASTEHLHFSLYGDTSKTVLSGYNAIVENSMPISPYWVPCLSNRSTYCDSNGLTVDDAGHDPIVDTIVNNNMPS